MKSAFWYKAIEKCLRRPEVLLKDSRVGAIVTDSRKVQPGDIFVAIRGERFDGHDYVQQVAQMGACAVVVDHRVENVRVAQWVVQDTRIAYGRLAHALRQAMSAKVLVVGGSNGKTTTTQMAAHVLQRMPRVALWATKGNFNNEIGVAQTLLGLQEQHTHAVIEAGMNHPGEMGYLSHWIAPNVVLLTNAQREHQEFLGTVEASAYENGHLIVALSSDGVAVYPASDACASIWESLARARGVRTMTYRADGATRADVWVEVTADGTYFVTKQERCRAQLSIHGAHNLHNAAGVVAALLTMGFSLSAIVAALEDFRALAGRGARTQVGDLCVIDDSYNANPDSVRASMQMTRHEQGPVLYILGRMGEVGANARRCHRELGAYARTLGIDAFWGIGPATQVACRAFGAKARWFATRQEARQAWSQAPLQKGVVTVKASHSAGLEKMVQHILQAA